MTRRLRLIPALAVVTSLLTAAPGAQQDTRAQAVDQQIDRIFRSGEYALPRFGPARWLADGTAYTTVERAAEPARVGTSSATTARPAPAAS